MATYSKNLLSGSTNGKNIKVSQTATPGTLIHTAHVSALDEIWLYAFNSSGASVKLTLEWGGVTSPDDTEEIYIAGESGLQIIIPGLLLTNSLVVRAFASVADVIVINGYVNRIS